MEIENLRQEANAMKLIRSRLSEDGAARLVFDKVFKDDINRLLAMADMWKHRTPPRPLQYNEFTNAAPHPSTNGTIKGASHLLKDQRSLDLQASFELFNTRYVDAKRGLACFPHRPPLVA